jgi:hypothetical protein
MSSPYTVKSQVSLTDFRAFLSALDNSTLRITNGNFRGLSLLCEEFAARPLSAQLSQFRSSADFKDEATAKDCEARLRLSVLEERMQQRQQETAALRSELTRQSLACEALIGRVELLQGVVPPQLQANLKKLRDTTGSLQTDVAQLKGRMSSLPLTEVQSDLKKLRDTTGALQTDVAQLKGRMGSLPLTEVQSDLKKLKESLARIEARGSSPSPKPGPVPVAVGTFKFDSAIIDNFPLIFTEFSKRPIELLWRGSSHGFGAADFHRRCNGKENTLTVIADTTGNIFGGYTPVKWDSSNTSKGDPSLKSFLFTLKGPFGSRGRKFPLRPDKKHEAIKCDSASGPSFFDIFVSDYCNSNTDSWTDEFGLRYTNDTGMKGGTFLIGANYFQVKEIEVFEIVI